MAKIIEGTTPTATYKFKTVKPAELAKAFFTVKVNGEVVIEKTLAEAAVGEDTLTWKLTQEETLLVGTRTATAMCNWILPDGTRGASTEDAIIGVSNHKKEVIRP